MAAMNSANARADLYSVLKKNHDEAFFVIDKAIKLEEEGRQNEAFSMYENGLVLLDKALSITLECPPDPDDSWEKACVMVQKMKKTRKEVLSRMADTQVTQESPTAVSPPTYEEAMSSPTSTVCGPLMTYHDLGMALQNLKVETGAQNASILYTQDNVRIYFISPDGTVSAPSEPQTLQIAQLEDEINGNKSRAYLQVGCWIYPLVPGVSPCYRTQHNILILPDVHSSVEGASVGLIFPEETEDSVYELLEDILKGFVSRITEVPTPRPATAPMGYSYSISRGIVTGAHFISHGLIRGAEKAGELMNAGTPKLIQKINPESTPRPVNPNVQKGLETAKSVTGTAVQITGFVASKIGSATMALGRYLAPHIQRQGTKLLSTTCNLTPQEASEKMDGVLEVTAGAIEGFSTVYNGLEQSAGILATNLANNTVKIVEHKYGHPVGEATSNTLYTVGNVFVAGNNVRYLTPKGIAKVTAKSTGKAVVEDYRKNLHNNSHPPSSGPSASD